MKRALKVTVGVASAGVFVAAVTDKRRREHVLGTADGTIRFARTFAYGTLAAYDYKFVLGPVEKEKGNKSDEYKELKKVIDKKNAERMLHVCRKHAAFYTKFGQYVSTLNHALPPEWTETLSELQDKARFRPWEDVQRVVEEDFGRPASELFQSIEPVPIAAASLAQVHKAVTFDGQTVAVKIQYPDLRRQAMNDMAAMYLFFVLVEALFPDYGYTWMFPEFKQVLLKEVDFLTEARNGERVAAQFSDDPHVHIPSVRRDLTTDRVLTMEFIAGAKVNDQAWMRANNVYPKAVAHAVTRFFAEQVHEKGMVHCDPHPGNLMLRTDPITRQWQLVVLDHGMYRRLTPAFRSAYCRLWRALLLRDTAEGEAACVELGLKPEEYDEMSLILTMRRASSKNALGGRMSREEAMQLYDKYRDVTPADINRFMQRLPRDLLFVARNANLVRSLNMSLGGTSRDRFKAHGRAAVKGLVLNDALQAAGIDIRGRTSTDAGAGAVSSTPAAAAGSAADGAPLAGSHDGVHGSMPQHGATAEVVLDSSSSVLGSIAALLGRPPPPREPITYVNALGRGEVIDEPTEYELLAAANARSKSGAAGKPSSTASLSLRQRGKLWWSWAQLEGTLWWMDLAFAAMVWWNGAPEVYIPPHTQDDTVATGKADTTFG